jgi:hypothetical protein
VKTHLQLKYKIKNNKKSHFVDLIVQTIISLNSQRLGQMYRTCAVESRGSISCHKIPKFSAVKFPTADKVFLLLLPLLPFLLLLFEMPA